MVGGAIPHQFIPAVEKGVRQVLGEGAIAGYPLQDVRVIVYDGKYHPVDSKEVAFVSAGRKAFLDAISQAGPIVLEPIVRVEITAPSESMGDITGDLATKRGRINGNNALPGNRVSIGALVPLAELNDYQSRLKSLTGGEGTYTMELSHYDPVPPRRSSRSSLRRSSRERSRSSAGVQHFAGDLTATGEGLVITRRQAISGASSALILGVAARAGESGTRPETAPDTLFALSGKKPLIRRTFRPPNLETPLADLRQPYTANDAFFVRYHLVADSRGRRQNLAVA